MQRLTFFNLFPQDQEELDEYLFDQEAKVDEADHFKDKGDIQ